ncbi:distal membrane-arm assembly complex protein 1 [Scomber scombrus]|uniref:Distal membrane-arm assembly complex protein 1 n=1 Tax=Scomber scombrus TaxID=13677 RepID=A0AAV1MSJ1_SCOSC|nr:distal membrane-arm assembly complex protein 1 [Scomber scombrus]
MSAAPAAAGGGATGGAADAPKSNQMFKNCWSCRLISGGGLLISGAYVFNAARKVMRLGGATSVGTVAQITFAACLASWGIVIIADPVGKAERKT